MPDNHDERARRIRELDTAHVWHPLTQHASLRDHELMIVTEGSGTTVLDQDGVSYLDAFSGLWNVNVGYGRKEIADAVYEQMRTLSYYPNSQITGPAAQLAGRLADILPGDLQHVFFSNSGSEANETAIKIARQYGRQAYPGENRYKIIARRQAYHGFTYGALSATGQATRRTKFEPLVPGFLHVNAPYCYRCPIGLQYPECGVACVEEVEAAVQAEGPETVVAVLVEPIIGGGGVIVPPDDYLPRLREICDQHELLLIVDEVITGFGRTGKLFACEHWGITPDIMTMAKGITSGYLPLGACAATHKVFEAFLGEPDDECDFAQVVTYGGHPVCCAAAIANLDILMSERLWENAEAVGNYLAAKLAAIDSPLVGDVRGKGLMLAVELVQEDGQMLGEDRTNAVTAAIRRSGVIVGKMSHVMRGPESILFVAPPLTISKSDADRIVDAFAAALTPP